MNKNKTDSLNETDVSNYFFLHHFLYDEFISKVLLSRKKSQKKKNDSDSFFKEYFGKFTCFEC